MRKTVEVLLTGLNIYITRNLLIRISPRNRNMSFEIFAINARYVVATISSLKLPSFRNKSTTKVIRLLYFIQIRKLLSKMM